LYEEAGKPDLATVVARACDYLPVGQRLTAPTVHQWLSNELAPASLEELNAFVRHLNDVVTRSGNTEYEVQPMQYWESLWLSAVRVEPKRSGEPHENALPNLEQSEHRNTIDGNSQLTGPSIQAREINGGVHVHPPVGVQLPTPRSPAVPVMRVQNEQETIEIYDEGLARIWITARLQMGPDNE
jgi:hypothetical protein